MQETQRCALLIKRHALSPFAAPAGLASTVQCCSLALLHCRALQASHNLALSPTLLRELWPACDQVSTSSSFALVSCPAVLAAGLPQGHSAIGLSFKLFRCLWSKARQQLLPRGQRHGFLYGV